MKREDWLLAQKTRRHFIEQQTKGYKPKFESIKVGWDKMCSSFCLSYPKEHLMYPHTACYSGLASHYGSKKGAVALVIGITDEYSGHTTPYELRLPYLDWVLNESPWADSFVTKSAAQCLRMHTIVQYTTVPGNLMVGGSVAVRRMWESTSIFYVWNDLVKAGVNKSLAYMLAHIANSNSSTGNSTNISWVNVHEGGHMNLALQDLTKSYALNFMKGLYKAESSYKTGLTYTGYSRMFECGDNKKSSYFAGWVVSAFRRRLKSKEGVVVEKGVVNPFVAAMPEKAVKSDKINYNLGIQYMAELAPAILKEIGYE